MPLDVLARLREAAPNLALQGLGLAVGAVRALPDRGPRRLRRPGGVDRSGDGSRSRRRGFGARVGISSGSRLRCTSRTGRRLVRWRPSASGAVPAPRRSEADRRATGCAAARTSARRCVAHRRRTKGWTSGSSRHSRRGAIGASIAYHLARRGARGRVLRRRRRRLRATGKAMGGVRQQFSTAAEVRLTQASIRFFERLGPPFFLQVGYLFLATTEEGLRDLEERRELQASLGVPVERVDPSFVPEVNGDDVLGAAFCRTDGCADPPAWLVDASDVPVRSSHGCGRARTRRPRDRVRPVVGRGRGPRRHRAARSPALPAAARTARSTCRSPCR